MRTEADGAEVEITSDGFVASRSRGVEFYRTALRFEGEVARFEKPNGATVVLERSADDLLATEPGKPQMSFRRLPP